MPTTVATAAGARRAASHMGGVAFCESDDGVAVATALFLGAPLLPSSTGGSPVTGALDLVGVVAVIATVVTIGLVGALSAVTIASSSERQRIGDLVAGTWVLNGSARGPPSVPIPVAAGAAPSG